MEHRILSEYAFNTTLTIGKCLMLFRTDVFEMKTKDLPGLSKIYENYKLGADACKHICQEELPKPVEDTLTVITKRIQAAEGFIHKQADTSKHYLAFSKFSCRSLNKENKLHRNLLNRKRGSA